MPQEPWKRAYQLGRIVPPVRRPEQPQAGGRRVIWAVAIVCGLLAIGYPIFVLLDQYYNFNYVSDAHRMRDYLRSTNRTGKPSAPSRPNRVDVASLDSGLDIDLTIMGSYLDLLTATREWNVPWKVTTTGPSTLRLSAPGVDVGVRNGLIESYTIELFKVFDDQNGYWKPWRKTLLCTHVAPDQTYRGVTGREDNADHFDLKGAKSIHAADGWVHPAYELLFGGGKLSGLKGGLEFGPAERAGESGSGAVAPGGQPQSGTEAHPADG